MTVTDLFLAKYSSSAGAQRDLPPHKDKSQWSFVVALNDEYTDGGTYFFEPHEIWKPGTGSAVFFHGQHLHAGLDYVVNLNNDYYVILLFS